MGATTDRGAASPLCSIGAGRTVLHIRPGPALGRSARSCGNAPALNSVEILPCADGSPLHMGEHHRDVDDPRKPRNYAENSPSTREGPPLPCAIPPRPARADLWGRTPRAHTPPRPARGEPGPPSGNTTRDPEAVCIEQTRNRVSRAQHAPPGRSELGPRWPGSRPRVVADPARPLRSAPQAAESARGGPSWS